MGSPRPVPAGPWMKMTVLFKAGQLALVVNLGYPVTWRQMAKQRGRVGMPTNFKIHPDPFRSYFPSADQDAQISTCCECRQKSGEYLHACPQALPSRNHRERMAHELAEAESHGEEKMRSAHIACTCVHHMRTRACACAGCTTGSSRAAAVEEKHEMGQGCGIRGDEEGKGPGGC